MPNMTQYAILPYLRRPAYNSRDMHAEDDILNLFLVRQKINSDPRKKNNCGDDSSMVPLDDEHLGDTIMD